MSGPTVTTASAVPPGVGVVGVPVASGLRPVGDAHGLDVAKLAAGGFEATVGETLTVAGEGVTLVAVGIGDPDRVTPAVLRRAAAALVRAAWRQGPAATTLLDALPEGADPVGAVQAVAEGVGLGAYRFTRYKSDPKPCRLPSLVVVTTADGRVGAALDRAAAVVEAVWLARDLANEPAGSLTPIDLAGVATEVAGRVGLGVEVVDEVEAATLGLGGLLGVARGSDQPPRLVRLVYDPPGARASVAVVGKGITFDSGGLSLKNVEGMMKMKTDMSGGAAVIGALSALPALAPPVKVVGLVPATENMPGGRATKPGDVLKTRDGTTVEVLNTDAEGRLVLADGLALAAEDRPDAIVDLATLTGACIVALGPELTGVMGTHPGLVDQVLAAAERADEPAWPLPLPARYRKQLDSEVADIKNVTDSRFGGALTAGLFLAEFVGEVPWAHLDIAGPSYADEDDGPTAKGATGVGVRTLLELLACFEAPGPPPG
ncbi:MAG: leucyl aminopeptidase [Acidimicrobiales bacterium]